MTREEKIKEVYSKYFKINWNKTTFGITFNDGWCMSQTQLMNHPNLKNIIDLFDYEDKGGPFFYFRPIELRGVETNNKWISISENELLPKPGTEVFIIRNGEISKKVWTIDHLDRLISETSISTETISKNEITHYQFLQLPTEMPIF